MGEAETEQMERWEEIQMNGNRGDQAKSNATDRDQQMA